MTSSASTVKPLRRDAQRNRERIVASARKLFARDGVEASVDEITRDAGVGMGTLYRHFQTKEELIDAVLEDAFAEIVGAAEQAVTNEDAWAGLVGFLEHVLGLHAVNRGMKDMLATSERGAERADAMRARIRPITRQLITRAQEQGTLRADFAPEDLAVLFWTGGRVIETTAAIAPDHWRRFLGLLLDGMRAESSTPLPAPPLTRTQLARAQRRKAA